VLYSPESNVSSARSKKYRHNAPPPLMAIARGPARAAMEAPVAVAVGQGRDERLTVRCGKRPRTAFAKQTAFEQRQSLSTVAAMAARASRCRSGKGNRYLRNFSSVRASE